MILHSSIETYLDAHGGDAPEAFRKLWKKSQWEMVYGHMVSDVGQAQFLRLMAQLMGARKVLDVGTGNGALLFKLCKKKFNADLKGIDYSEASIKLATSI